jgi:DNA repair exonuclease SbcCD nuclease subunit
VVVERPRGAVPIAVHGVSFAQKHVPESLLPRYKAPVADAVNIGLMHTSLGEPEGVHARYAPCSLAELQGSGFRYWALGHIHRRFVAEGACTVVMPGMPQGRDIGEAGARSVTLATVHDDGAISLEARPTAVAQFERVPVPVAAEDDWEALAGRIDAALGAALDGIAADHLVARLQFTGATALAWRMRADLDLLANQAVDRATVLGRCWIDKVEVGCTAPEAARSDDPLVELGRLMREEVAPGAAFRDELAAMAAELRRQLPAECRAFLGETPEQERAALDGLLGEGVEDVLARLRGRRPA